MSSSSSPSPFPSPSSPSPHSSGVQLSLSIPASHYRTVNHKNVVYYEVQCRLSTPRLSSPLSDVLFKRFSDFVDLDSKIRKNFPDLPINELPKKKVFGNLDKGFVEKRRKELEAYLVSLIHHPNAWIRKSADVLSFLPPSFTRDQRKDGIYFTVEEVGTFKTRTILLSIHPSDLSILCEDLSASSGLDSFEARQEILIREILSLSEVDNSPLKVSLNYTEGEASAPGAGTQAHLNSSLSPSSPSSSSSLSTLKSRKKIYEFRSPEDRLRFLRSVRIIQYKIHKWKGKEGDKSLNPSQKPEYMDISVYCTSFNMAQASTLPGSAADWLPLEGDGPLPSIVAIGVQECAVALSLIADFCSKALKGKYHCVAKKNLWAIALLVFVRNEMVQSQCIQAVETNSVATGIMGILGNKGGVAVSLKIHSFSLCFVNTHLAAHDHCYADRNRMFEEIDSSLKLANNEMDLSIQYDTIYWIGDLNYRIELSHKRVLECISHGEYESLFPKDQLRRAQFAQEAFSAYCEGKITFPPTYKYVMPKKHKNKGKDNGGERQRAHTTLVPSPSAEGKGTGAGTEGVGNNTSTRSERPKPPTAPRPPLFSGGVRPPLPLSSAVHLASPSSASTSTTLASTPSTTTHSLISESSVSRRDADSSSEEEEEDDEYDPDSTTDSAEKYRYEEEEEEYTAMATSTSSIITSTISDDIAPTRYNHRPIALPLHPPLQVHTQPRKSNAAQPEPRDSVIFLPKGKGPMSLVPPPLPSSTTTQLSAAASSPTPPSPSPSLPLISHNVSLAESEALEAQRSIEEAERLSGLSEEAVPPPSSLPPGPLPRRTSALTSALEGLRLHSPSAEGEADSTDNVPLSSLNEEELEALSPSSYSRHPSAHLSTAPYVSQSAPIPRPAVGASVESANFLMDNLSDYDEMGRSRDNSVAVEASSPSSPSRQGLGQGPHLPVAYPVRPLSTLKKRSLHSGRAYAKKRIPSWCDRILWRCLYEGAVRLVYYNRCESLQCSDHLAVRALFDMRIPLPPPLQAYSHAAAVYFSSLSLDLTYFVKNNNNSLPPLVDDQIYIEFNGPFLAEASRGKRTGYGQLSERVSSAEEVAAAALLESGGGGGGGGGGVVGSLGRPVPLLATWTDIHIPVLQTTLGVREFIANEKIYYSIKSGAEMSGGEGGNLVLGQGIIRLSHLVNYCKPVPSARTATVYNETIVRAPAPSSLSRQDVEVQGTMGTSWKFTSLVERHSSALGSLSGQITVDIREEANK